MIWTDGLTKRFGDLIAVDGINLHVSRGEVLGLLGPNGAGKTTTVRMLASVLLPSSGRAQVAGFDVASDAQEVRRRVGVLTEAPGLYTRMTGREYLDFFGRLRGIPAQVLEKRIDALSRIFGIAQDLERRLSEYSRGMQQKVALVRTLLHNPPVLLFDEPTSAMDPESARLVRDAILQLRGSSSRAIVICTHNLLEAEELCDRIAIIHRGRVIQMGTPSELKARLVGPPLMELRLAGAWLSDGADMLGNGLRSLVERYASLDETGAGWVRYRTPDPESTNPRLLAAMAQAGFPVVTLSRVEQSLESVYLSAVREEAGTLHSPESMAPDAASEAEGDGR